MDDVRSLSMRAAVVCLSCVISDRMTANRRGAPFPSPRNGTMYSRMLRGSG